MIVEKKAANNERLISTGFAADWHGDPVALGLPYCATCRAWFISEGMAAGHMNNVHAQGLRTMKDARQQMIEQLGRLRDELTALNARVETMHGDVLKLDAAIAEKEAALAAAQQPKDGVPVPTAPDSGRVSLGA